MDDLRSRGEFFEYLEGDGPAPPEPGVVTVGEQTDRGTVRLFSLYPEAFPDVYDRREARRLASQAAIRKVILALAE